MDENKVTEFQDRLFNELNSGMSILNLQLGYNLGLFELLNSSGPVDSTTLAEQTGYSERYMREWLECMAVGGYLDHDSETSKFSLPFEHADCPRNEHAAYVYQRLRQQLDSGYAGH